MALAVMSLWLNNDDLVDYLVRTKYIKTPEIEQVFRVVDRANYIPAEDKINAYNRPNTAFNNGNIHISSPCFYSLVMEHLQLEPALSFLNIGSGTGYLSTLVGLIIGTLGVNHGIEIHEDVVDYAHQKLRESRTKIPALNFLQFCEPVFIKGNGLCLSRDTSQYDRVYCGAACPENYENYMKSLVKVGGVLVMPLNNQLLQITRTSETQWQQRSITSVSFSYLQQPDICDQIITLPETSMQPPSTMSTVRSGNSSGQQKPQLSLLANNSPKESKPFSSSSEDEDMATEVGIEAVSYTQTSTSLPRNVPRKTFDDIVREDSNSERNELLQNLKQITERLQELIECPICYDTLDSTLIQCKNGHGVCSSCGSKIDECPTCKQEFAVRQSTLLGQILECLPKLCPYVDKGCSAIVLEQNHKTFCKFRPSNCRNTLCGWSGSVKDLIVHVQTCGKSKVCEISSNAKEPRCFKIDRTKNMFFYTPLIFQNQLFWKYFHRNVKTKHIYFRFYHVATSKPTRSYYFIVSFKKGKIEHTSSFKAFTDIADGNDDGEDSGIMLSDSELERYRSPKESDQYEYSIELVTEDDIA